MIPTEVKARFEDYQYKRNKFIARSACENNTMHIIPDDECDELLNIMVRIYDYAYRQAINDCMALNEIEFPNNHDRGRNDI